MKLNKYIYIFIITFSLSCSSNLSREEFKEPDVITYNEKHRPGFHFSPPKGWMNDPNGMVYNDGEYHLFYQHFPDTTVWGPMHWGHATSSNLIYWEDKGVKLRPDSQGYIFSGSAVLDIKNTSGFGSTSTPPLVAVYTYHDPLRERAGRVDYQYQGVAYSLNNGTTWNKYEENPVLRNPGISDFRDPKVFWHEETNKWIMVLAVKDHVEFYGSENLLQWYKLSEFGAMEGSHEGVWECPDLVRMPVEGTSLERWVLLVSIGTGGPRGSATQYFIGDFDGFEFSYKDNLRENYWLDYGWDNYAGVTWSNLPENDQRTIFIGWMNNWLYAEDLPVEPWKGSMTTARKLTVTSTSSGPVVKSYPVEEFNQLRNSAIEINKTLVNGEYDLSGKTSFVDGNLLDFELLVSRVKGNGSWSLNFKNYRKDTLKFGYDHFRNEYFLDRSAAGNTDFHPAFEKVHYAPRFSRSQQQAVRILLDRSSVEVFADLGEVTFTDRYFTDLPFDTVWFETQNNALLLEGMVYGLNSIWNNQ